MKHGRHIKHEAGFSVVEVLISLGMAGIIVASIGNTLAATHRLTQASALKEEASAQARKIVEAITANQRSLFSCVCNDTTGPEAGGTCATNTCTRIFETNAQQCQTASLYQSCWTEFPNGLKDNTGPYHYDFALNTLATGNAAIDPQFTQTITISNLPIANPDPNRKEINVSVSWVERGMDKNVVFTTILTGWKNETP